MDTRSTTLLSIHVTIVIYLLAEPLWDVCVRTVISRFSVAIQGKNNRSTTVRRSYWLH
jgi:hypothetical protein